MKNIKEPTYIRLSRQEREYWEEVQNKLNQLKIILKYEKH